MAHWLGLQALLFDYDGTLRDSVGEIHRGVCGVLQQLNLPIPTLTDFHNEFSLPAEPYWRKLGVDLPLHEILSRWSLECDLETTDLFVDTKPVLERLYGEGVIMALISGHRHEFVMRHTKECGIDHYFAHIEGEASHKAARIRGFIDRLGIPPERAAYVGDLSSDMRDALEAGVTAIGITRETGSREVLEQAGAQLVIRNLHDLLAVDALPQGEGMVQTG